MSIVSETEVVKLLENRRKSLSIELKRVDDALEILKSGSGNPRSEVRPRPSKVKSVEKQTNLAKKIVIPKTYDQSRNWDEKVLFALSKKGNSFKEDIAKEIFNLEPGANEPKLINLISVKLSALLKQGVIRATKEGRKFRYSVY